MEHIDVCIDDLEYPDTEKIDLGSTVIWYADKICEMKRIVQRCKGILKLQPNNVYIENQMYHIKATIAELEKEKQQAKARFQSLQGEPTELPSEPDTDTSSESDNESVKATQGSFADLTEFDEITLPDVAGSYSDSAESTQALNTPRSDESAESQATFLP